MVDEPDSLVLRMLREIRGKLDEHDRRFEQIEQRFDAVDRRFEYVQQHVDSRFDGIEERFDELRDVVTHAFGLTAANDVKLRQHNVRLKDADGWRQRTEETLSALDRRVGKLEDQTPS